MIPSLSFDELNRRLREKYSPDEKRIVGIMLARYDTSLVKDVIAQCYLYWHENSGRDFDVFWAGYGEYLHDESPTKQILDYRGNDTGNFFDRTAFISCKKAINEVIRPHYKDKFELILVNYHNGYLNFSKTIRINLEKNIDEHYANIREIIEYITEECRSEYDIKKLARKMVKREFGRTIKGMNIGDIMDLASSTKSLFTE